MANKFTVEQQRAVDSNGSNILVAAAAGSGKTTVLVERIVQKIIKDKIDIDRLLIVTFTNAAASEMRERILEALYSRIDENSDDKWLSKQVLLLNKASICTIDSFCLDVIKNNFFEIGISPNFRIADNVELDILKQEVLDELFEDLYESKEEFFEKLVKVYTGYQGDEPLKETVLRIFQFIQSNPFPEEWLEEKVKEFDVKDKKKNGFENTIWGDILLQNAKEEVEDDINQLKVIKRKIDKFDELEKYSNVLNLDISGLESILNSITSWDSAYETVYNFKFKTWPTDRKISMDVKDEAKKVRDIVREKYKKMVDKTFLYDSEEAFDDIYEMYDIIDGLKRLVLLFCDSFSKKKQEKSIMDFSDIEHYALNILLKKDEDGNYIKTEVARKYQEKYKEIAIDEYQDSNLVQEYLLSSISDGKNIFMVGDVKQSIYKFRQASPELFLDKYEKYDEKEGEDGLKIKLFKNFRSRKEVLDFANLIFENIMSKKLGDIDYDESEFLNPGAVFDLVENQDYKTVLNVIDLKEDEDDGDERQLEKTEIEAKFVTNEIRKLIDSKFQVYDRNVGFRDITYKDIVILLRTTSGVASVFEKELYDNGIPVFSDSSLDYLNSIEIQTVISFLKVVDNPTDDISLVTVLRSPIFGFDDNELVEIRLKDREGAFYSSLKAVSEDDEFDSNIREKVIIFLNLISNFRKMEEYLSLDEFIWKIYEDTDYLNYVKLMPNGEIREANLRMLFERAKDYEKVSFKGLYNFIRYIERIKNQDSDLSSAKVIGENENVVRIMSIHKSKGLEFPVVFLCRTDKNFNMRDLNEPILMHSSLGIGPKYINYERKIEYDTAAKNAIKLKVKDESISEEMRILYVAVTRAKEKLIVTGIENDLEKELENKKELLNVYKKDGEKFNHLLVKKYKSYLDWLELVYINNKDKDLVEFNSIKKSDIDLVLDLQEKKSEISFNSDKNFSEIDKLINWKYRWDDITLIPSKLSVSKIKELQTEEVYDNRDIEKPEFMRNKKITSSQIGTLTHLVLQNLDLKKKYSVEELKEFLEGMVFKNKITEAESKAIRLNSVSKFIDSKLYERLMSAKVIEKEKPFYINVPISDVYDIDSDEMILVQGIVDLYFIDSDNKLVLVDYKTDYVEKEEELVDKYSVQLGLYKKALEESLGRKVDEVYIYSTCLNREIFV
ncbi:MAG: helicase-exonuclease AddAB subunit AddA [Clostridia bacterium]|nr:helicase-exonuclease AddAB subunit AddA [Clostridia bacterium]